jgi:hypothetical protein
MPPKKKLILTDSNWLLLVTVNKVIAAVVYRCVLLWGSSVSLGTKQALSLTSMTTGDLPGSGKGINLLCILHQMILNTR